MIVRVAKEPLIGCCSFFKDLRGNTLLWLSCYTSKMRRWSSVNAAPHIAIWLPCSSTSSSKLTCACSYTDLCVPRPSMIAIIIYRSGVWAFPPSPLFYGVLDKVLETPLVLGPFPFVPVVFDSFSFSLLSEQSLNWESKFFFQGM